MPRRVSGDVADWCLSFISAPLIWPSSCFIIISAENPYRIIVPFPSVHTCRAGRTVSQPQDKNVRGRRQRAAALSPLDSFKEIEIKENWSGRRVFYLLLVFFPSFLSFFLFFLIKGCSVKQNSDCEVTFSRRSGRSPLMPPARMNEQTNKQRSETECNHWPLFKEAI